MKIFYHNDADGKCSGYLVAKYAKTDPFEKNIIMKWIIIQRSK